MAIRTFTDFLYPYTTLFITDRQGVIVYSRHIYCENCYNINMDWNTQI